MTTPAPKGEIGTINVLPSWGALAGMDPADPPPFQYPSSIATVNRMRTDPQIDGLCSGVLMPINRFDWRLNPNGARDEVVEQISTDLGIPIKGYSGPVRRSRRRFNHTEFREHALLALWYGHMFFEQVPDTEKYDLARDGWRLRKLAPRMPSSIQKIHVAGDGGLEGITQFGYQPPILRGRRGVFGDAAPQIPVSQLAAYVWKKEGANWTGRSMLRPLYQPWILKDRALRVDAIKNERFGIGIPTATAPEGGDPAAYSKMAQAIRVSETSGVGLPSGAGVGVEGIRGTLPDVMASIRYYDEQMARNFMEMVVQLGQTQTGSRALGNTFADFFQMLVEAIANWYTAITNEHVIEDLVDWNWDEDEQAPLLEWGYAENTPLAVTDLVAMVQSGAITMDTETERSIREQTNLPALPDEYERPSTLGNPASAPPPVAAARKGRSFAARKQMANDPVIGHRQPNEFELAARTDFEEIQERWQDATADLVSTWRADVQSVQIAALAEQVQNAVQVGDNVALVNLSAPVVGKDALAAAMREMAEDAIVGAKAEATLQGVSIGLVNLDEGLNRLIDQRAEATSLLLSRSIADSAARAAINLGAESLSPAEVAAAVQEHLEGLSDAYLNDMLGGALTQAQNTGRRAVMKEKPASIYASELLDGDTCTNCTAVDGRKYSSVDAADADYPTGGHKDCKGGPRCRGTLVAVYDEAND